MWNWLMHDQEKESVYIYKLISQKSILLFQNRSRDLLTNRGGK
uniref:Uncharacterized protein n=1 Tax=Rhizophora mucronata TaxID=61149 RepID=A0A2P2QEP5_RHIMU